MPTYRVALVDAALPEYPIGAIADGQVLGRVGNALIGVTVSGAGDPAFAPGSFTVATGTFRYFAQRVVLTSSGRATLAGTGMLRIG